MWTSPLWKPLQFWRGKKSYRARKQVPTNWINFHKHQRIQRRQYKHGVCIFWNLNSFYLSVSENTITFVRTCSRQTCITDFDGNNSSETQKYFQSQEKHINMFYKEKLHPSINETSTSTIRKQKHNMMRLKKCTESSILWTASRHQNRTIIMYSESTRICWSSHIHDVCRSD